ncbi:hypothetical protein L6R53_14330 [Myxococcota bacterium]|nr:hypothetical protein [Myxococcota bacterium]
MRALVLASLLTPALSSPARAGDLLLRTEVPVELSIGTTALTSTWGPATLRVTGLDPGVAGLRITRGDRTDVLDVRVPDQGAAGLTVRADGVSAEAVDQPEAPPMVELRAAQGQRFAVVLDGQRVATLGSTYPLRLEGLAAGSHRLELRTPDLTVVWARADLELQADDVLVVTGQEGYAPLVSGRPGAFTLVGSSAAAPAAGSAPAGG